MSGKTKDLPVLARLLHSSEADARIGAASGSLYILEAEVIGVGQYIHGRPGGLHSEESATTGTSYIYR